MSGCEQRVFKSGHLAQLIDHSAENVGAGLADKPVEQPWHGRAQPLAGSGLTRKY